MRPEFSTPVGAPQVPAMQELEMTPHQDSGLLQQEMGVSAGLQEMGSAYGSIEPQYEAQHTEVVSAVDIMKQLYQVQQQPSPQLQQQHQLQQQQY